MAKYGKRGAQVLRTVDEAEQAAHLDKQAEKALEEIERRKTVTTPNKKAKSNPDQHSEFIDVERNWPGSKRSFQRNGDFEKILNDNDFRKIYEDLKSDKLKRVYSKVFNLEEEAIIRFYQGKDYYKLNQSLISKSETVEMILLERQLNKVLDKIPSKPGTYFRGAGKEEINKIIKTEEKIINYDNFLSSSSEKYIAIDFVKRNSKTDIKGLLIIESKNGKSLEWGRSELRGEFEMLHKSKTQFEIKHIEYVEKETLNLYEVATEGATPDIIEKFYLITLKEK